MEAGKLFETATRNKMRFPFRGMISVEDLWDLSLTNLDSVFKTLNAEAKKSEEVVEAEEVKVEEKAEVVEEEKSTEE